MWTRFYRIRQNMKNRCYNPKHERYKDYGGRWITVCGKWKNSFIDFYNDKYCSYEKHFKNNNGNTTIDRKNNDWNYCKSNCTWATTKEQSMNRHNTLYYKWKYLKDWCLELWLNYKTVYSRLYRGKTTKEALGL